MELDPTPTSDDASKPAPTKKDDSKDEAKPKKAPVVLEPQGPLASELPEGDVYVSLLVVVRLLDQKEYAQVSGHEVATKKWLEQRLTRSLWVCAGQEADGGADRDDHRTQPADDGPARVQGLLLLGSCA